MVIFSSLKPLIGLTSNAVKSTVPVRCMSGHRTFPYQTSRWQWKRFKDQFHFYFMLGVIPCTLGVFGANVFVGPATLCEIPEDYVPKYWEYYRNPVTRFIARYFLNDPQQDYEKYLAHIYIEDETRKLRILEKKIQALIAERHDYKMYYYRPVAAKYHRITREAAEEIKELTGK